MPSPIHRYGKYSVWGNRREGFGLLSTETHKCHNKVMVSQLSREIEFSVAASLEAAFELLSDHLLRNRFSSVAYVRAEALSIWLQSHQTL